MKIGSRLAVAVTAAAVMMSAGLAVAHASAPQSGPGNSAILKRILHRGAINIGHREASVPFSYINDNQQVVGYSIDLCLLAVEAVRQRLEKSDLKIDFTPINVTNRIPLVTMDDRSRMRHDIELPVASRAGRVLAHILHHRNAAIGEDRFACKRDRGSQG